MTDAFARLDGLTWEPGQVCQQALKMTPAVNVELADAGRTLNGPAFSYSTWVQFPGETERRHARARWTTKTNTAGWDLWVEDGKIATHIIHEWPDNAIKVVARGRSQAERVAARAVTYDGPSKADGREAFTRRRMADQRVKSKTLTKNHSHRYAVAIGAAKNRIAVERYLSCKTCACTPRSMRRARKRRNWRNRLALPCWLKKRKTARKRKRPNSVRVVAFRNGREERRACARKKRRSRKKKPRFAVAAPGARDAGETEACRWRSY